MQFGTSITTVFIVKQFTSDKMLTYSLASCAAAAEATAALSLLNWKPSLLTQLKWGYPREISVDC